NYAWDRAKQIPVVEPQSVAPERRQIVEAMLQKRREFLKEAHDEFQSLARDLEERFVQEQRSESLKGSATKLGMDEYVLARSAFFNVGLIKIDLGDYLDALDYARSLQVRYKGRPESLFAVGQIHSCWKQLARTDDRPQIHQVAAEAIQT